MNLTDPSPSLDADTRSTRKAPHPFLSDINVRKALEAGGNEPTLDESADQFAAFLRRENDRWREIVKLTGVKAE